MKRSLIARFSLVLGVLVLSSCQSSGAGGTDSTLILEHSAGISGQVPWGDTAASGTIQPAQSFTVSQNAMVTKVRVRTLGTVGNPTAYYRVGIRADDGGKPATTALASRTKTAAEIAIDSWDDWVLDSPVTVSSGQTYWIVCTTSAMTGEDDYFELAYTTSGDAYAGGEFGQYTDGLWDTLAGRDLWFQLYN